MSCVEFNSNLDYIADMNAGRQLEQGQLIPLATSVADARYCFPGAPKSSVTSTHHLLCAGVERCLPTFHVERTNYPCVLIEFVVQGKGRLRVDNNVHGLYPGSLFCYRMDTPHDIWADPSDPMKKYFAAFLPAASPRGVDALGIAPGTMRWTRDVATVQMLFDELIREGQLASRVHQHLATRYLELILLKAGEAAVPNGRHIARGADAYQRLVAIIDEQFASVSGLADLQAQTGLQPNYICRLFRQFGRETPIECITRHRVNRAAQMLLTSNVSVSAVAREVGYEDPYYFSRVFKKRFGKSPRDFRCSATIQELS